MSKELEALNYLVGLAVVGNKENHRGKIFESEEIILKALKRNEPMKPNYDGKYLCPVCGNLLHSLWQKHCDNCTQAIDWSDEK